MATAFGLSELKSKLDDWRGGRKIERVVDVDEADPIFSNIRTVDTRNELHDLSLLLENLVIPRLIADRTSQAFWQDSTASDLADVNVRATSERRTISGSSSGIAARTAFATASGNRIRFSSDPPKSSFRKFASGERNELSRYPWAM